MTLVRVHREFFAFTQAMTLLQAFTFCRANSLDEHRQHQDRNVWAGSDFGHEVPASDGGASVNKLWQIEEKNVRKIADGIYRIAGWGIGNIIAVEAPKGWIIVDTRHKPLNELGQGASRR